MRQTELVATLTEAPADDGEALRALPAGVSFLEVRADLVGERLDPDWLRARFAGELIYTLRSVAEGGRFEGGRKARQERLRSAVGDGYDLIDLEAERDCRPELLVDVPAARRLVSWHGKAAHLNRLQRRFAKLAATEARYYKLIPTARVAGDDVGALALLRSLRRDDTVIFALGPIGTWTRLVAPRLGSPLVFGALGETPAAPGQLSIARLVEDFGMPYLSDVEKLYGIAGNPVQHSLSPRVHNGAYRALGIPALYVPFHVESFADFWLDVVESGSLEALGVPLFGLSVTAPHKEVALAVSGASSPRAQHIGAANTLTLRAEADGKVWEAETTDPEGVTHTLEAAGIALAGTRAAVVGCGGAGKAAAYGLQLAGCAVTLVNRTEARGRTAAIELQLPFVSLAEFDAGRYDLLINATALGHGAADPPPFAVADLRPEAVVVDMVYARTGPTALIRAARGRGLRAFGGRSVLLHQALEQFRLMTGRSLNDSLARELLGMETAAEPGSAEAST